MLSFNLKPDGLKGESLFNRTSTYHKRHTFVDREEPIFHLFVNITN